MKRIIFALIFLVFAFCAAAIEVGYISGKVEIYTDKIEKADSLMYKGENEEAYKECVEIENEWNESQKLIDIVLIHDYVDAIGNSIGQMKSYVLTDNKDNYFATSVVAKKELASIKDSEFPYVENIL